MARWTDGLPVTAHDFVYAWRRVVDPATAAMYAYLLNCIENAEEITRGKLPIERLGVRAVDDFCLNVDLATPTPFFLQLLSWVTFMSELKDMKSRAQHLGHSGLRSFTDENGHVGLEQNANTDSKWAKLAREGHEVAWDFDSPGGSYTGRLLIDRVIYTPSEATKAFLKP